MYHNPNAYMHTFRNHLSFILGYFFPVSIPKYLPLFAIKLDTMSYLPFVRLWHYVIPATS